MKKEDMKKPVMENEKKPSMKIIFEIVGIKKVKDSKIKPSLSIYHVEGVPVSKIKNDKKGEGLLEQVGLKQEFKGLLEEIYKNDQPVFTVTVPMTQKTIDLNGYEIGSHFRLEITKI